MLIDYDSHPRKSIIYNASILLIFLRKNQNASLEQINEFCKEQEIDFSQMIFSLDWLFLIGKISNIDKVGRISL